MHFPDIFKDKNLTTLIAVVIVCILLSLLGIPNIAIYIVMFAIGYNHKNFAQWIEDKILSPFKKL